MSLARRFCADESDAEELVNRTFAAVVEDIDGFLMQSSFFTWMVGIITNLHAMDRRRKSNQTVVYPGDIPQAIDEDAHEEIYRRIDASFVCDAVQSLPKEMRAMHGILLPPSPRAPPSRRGDSVHKIQAPSERRLSQKACYAMSTRSLWSTWNGISGTDRTSMISRGSHSNNQRKSARKSKNRVSVNYLCNAKKCTKNLILSFVHQFRPM